MSHPLLELQAADTMAEQLRYRREHLPERDRVQAAKNDLLRWNQAVTLRRDRMAALTTEIEADEARGQAIDAQRTKLNAQLRTVMAIREAEALQHELATLADDRSALDDSELEALEEQSRLDDELVVLAEREGPLRDVYVEADAVLKAAAADIDAELERVAHRLDGLRAAVDKAQLKRYDALRKDGPVAAAALVGSRCEGCHLDLAPAELDKVRASAKSGGVTDCPNCGRLLVVA